MSPEGTSSAATIQQTEARPANRRPGNGNVLLTAAKLGRDLGPGWLLYRLWYAAKLKSGVMRRQMPPRPWDAQPLTTWVKSEVPTEPPAYLSWRESQPQAFFFKKPDDHFRAYLSRPTEVLTETDGILQGRWRYFQHSILEVGFPPQWSLNPMSRRSAPTDQHWSQMGDFDHGDIKMIWEASRFSIAFTLVRAYVASRDERYAAAFWTLLEDWALHNPPQLGPNWKCGQETSFRVMAWCFALFGLAASAHSTPERVASMAAMLAVHAARIEGNISYALSQRNNHGLSEATGLWTVGLLFPEFKRAARWRELGKHILEDEASRQIAEDGSYIQHSFNYHRVMLHDYLWALRLGELNGQRLSTSVYQRIKGAVEFLGRHTDSATGHAPNYGSNDGSIVLPLNSCDYSDFRPVLQACHYLLHRGSLYPPGPWDEDLLWLFGPEAIERASVSGREAGIEIVAGGAPGRIASKVIRNDPPESCGIVRKGTGGYSVMRGQTSRAMIRCAHYNNRPGHADQLHLDLWWREANIACDAGTYLYNGEAPWGNGLAGTNVHNTVTVDNQDQMTRAGRFLWLDWAQGKISEHSISDKVLLESWQGEHDGYRKVRVTHRRAVLRAQDDVWIVVDDLVGSGEHLIRLHWLLADFPFDLQEAKRRLLLRTPAGPLAVQMWSRVPAILDLVRAGRFLTPQPGPQEKTTGDDENVRGWRSRYYAEKEPALSLALQARAALPMRFITVLAADPVEVGFGEVPRVNVLTPEAKLDVELSLPGTSPIIQETNLIRGNITDRLASPASVATSRARPSVHTLLIHQSFTPPAQGGGTRHYELASRLVKQGHQFTIIASDVDYLTGKLKTDKRRLVTEQELDGVRVLSAYTYSSLHRSFVHRVISFLSFCFTSVLAALRVKDVDLVIGSTPPIFQAVSAWWIAKLRGRPFVLEVRDLWPEFAIDMGVLKNPILIGASRWLERFLYRHAEHIIVNSPAYRDYLVGKGVADGRVTLIANGVDPEMFEAMNDGRSVRAKFGLDDRFVVTYAGALGMANDLETMLRAADHLRGDREIHFLLVGDGKERAHLEAQAQALHLSNVTFTGSQPKSQMAAYLAASDACVAILKDIPMFRTTYPNKVFDYMAASRPTILAIDGVVRKVIDDSGGGIFVPPGDDAALAEAVRSLSRDRERAQAMGMAARAYVIRHFHRQGQADQLASLLSKLVSRGAMGG